MHSQKDAPPNQTLPDHKLDENEPPITSKRNGLRDKVNRNSHEIEFDSFSGPKICENKSRDKSLPDHIQKFSQR